MSKILFLKVLASIVVGFALITACTPSYWNRNISVSHDSLKILKMSKQILTKELWQKEDVVFCKNSNKLTLFCALKKASIEVLGKYKHHQP